jgi:hypothetical protein
MLRLAPTLSVAALLAIMLAGAAPVGAAVLLKFTMKESVAVSLRDPALKELGGDTGAARAIAAKDAPMLGRFAALRVEPLRIEPRSW